MKADESPFTSSSSEMVTIRRARSDDKERAVELITMAAESLLTLIFGNGDKQQTKAFLYSAWNIEYGQFGFGQHTVICLDDVPVGICTHWQKQMPDIFAKHTAKSIVDFFTPEQAQQVIMRSKAATYAILIPPEDAMIIGHVAVLPAHRRCGFAEKLVNYIAQLSREQGKNCLGLDVEEDNASAIQFYTQLGFSKDESGPDRSPFVHMKMAL
jgi:GNAT superfamily N-acetyltransferase